MFATRRTEPDGFRSQRSLVLARGGMVCTSQPLASAAGAHLLRAGGNAVDAAVCAAAVLGVVEPYSTGPGGDCFLLIWHAADHILHALNGSGRAPASLSLDRLQERGLTAVPMHGMLPVTVPGAVAAWADALQRFGARDLRTVLEPAIDYARHGFPVSEIIAHEWDLIVRFGVLQGADAWRAFTRDGRAPRLGEVFRQPELAGTLERIASGGPGEFYTGEIARRIVACSIANGGLLSAADLAEHRSSWVEPISTDYRGYRLFELPPSAQGLTALVALNILENFDVAAHAPDTPESLHRRIEAVKLAIADRNRYIADPECVPVPIPWLLSKDYAQGRAALIHPRRTLKQPRAGHVGGTDTVYVTAADSAGNVVSLINSLYFPFGSGMVVGGTGIALQNRGYGFVTDPTHPNCLAPRKRPLHTIIPAMLFRNEQPLVSFGVMGGDVQAQAHVQVVSNLVDYGMNIQEALDYPRFHYVEGDRVALEPEHEASLREDLTALGHDLRGADAVALRGGFGGGQGIMIDPSIGCYWGGSDRRKDGCAIGF